MAQNALKPNLFDAPQNPTFAGFNPATSPQQPSGGMMFNSKAFSEAFSKQSPASSPPPLVTPVKKVHNDKESYSIQTPNKPPKLSLLGVEVPKNKLEGTSGMSAEFLKMYLMVEQEIDMVSLFVFSRIIILRCNS